MSRREGSGLFAFLLATVILVGLLMRPPDHRVKGQITSPATTGMVAQLPRGSGAPAPIITCNAAAQYLPYYDTVGLQLYVCDGSWKQITNTGATSSAFGSVMLASGQTSDTLATVATTGSYTDLINKPTIPSGLPVYVNGTLQTGTVKCGFATGTTSGAGTITLNPSTALGGITALVGVPQPTVTGAGATTTASVNVTGTPTATSVSLYVTTAATISVVGINVSLFSAAALPVSVFVCGQ